MAKIALPRARLSEFGEAPFGGEPVLGEDQNDGLRALKLAVEPPLPIVTRRDAGLVVEIEKRFVESDPVQPCLHALGGLTIHAGMGNEDARHAALLGPLVR